MTPDAALDALRAAGDAGIAEDMARYHKVDRPYFGISNLVINDLTTGWRKSLDHPGLVALADGLWASNIHEARIAAGKLFVQARMRPDDHLAWAWIEKTVPEFDAWAIADAVAMGGQKRVVQDPSRLKTLARWTTSDHLWTRRAAFVFALPFGKSRHPSDVERAARVEVLTWCSALRHDPEWFIQKAIAWWLRDLSKRDPEFVSAWLQADGQALKPFAQKEAGKYLT